MRDQNGFAGSTMEIVSEAHGPHWVAWAVRGDDRTPAGAVVVVGQTKQEAEKRARAWANALPHASQS